jgi:Flp pilus assembly protein TadD
MEAASRGYLALALHRLGRSADAFTEIHAAVALARSTRQVLPSMLAILAEMELDVGRPSDALGHAEEAVTALRETRSDGAHDIQVRVAYARSLAGVGRGGDAHVVFREAHASLRARIELIQTPHLRACFEHVAENKLVLDWARTTGNTAHP